MRNRLSAIALLLAGAATPAFAVDAVTDAPDTELHAPPSTEIIVTAPFARDRATVLSGITILQGTELTRQLRSTLGDTLSRQAGVSSTSFGPNASRPILRGFQGERVRILTDGIGSFDVSNTSVDHAVVINPLFAERIEILRGPASLLYGSSAIGGVVNVIDKRIPREVPQEAVHLDVLGTYASAANERNIAGVAEVPLGDRFVVHVDGSYNKTDDLRIGGFVLSGPARAAALASPEPEGRALASLADRLPNTAGETWNAGAGVAFIDAGGELGIGYGHYDSLYGVPARYDTTTGEGEFVRLKVKQDRLDIRGQVNVGGDIIDTIKVRAGFADYQHSELAPSGEIGTTFYNRGLEGRLEVSQARRSIGGGTWKGGSGVQVFTRDFNVIGEEAFIPRNQSSQLGVFTLQELDFGALKAEFAGRYENAKVSAAVGDFRGAPVFVDRSFDLFSGSAGASVGLFQVWRIGVNLSHTERGPAAEELLANGPHAGTQAYEIGNPDFAKERSNGAEIVLRGRGEGYSFETSVYYNRFANYIYESQTGAVEDGLPVFQFNQASARYLGVEAQGEITVARFGDQDLKLDALADYTDAKLLGGLGPVPRIPPFRVLAGIGATGPVWDARAEIEHSSSQKKVAAFETETAGYTMVNASVSVRPFADRPNTSLVLSANNIFDVDARRHASFLKDFAPLPGRDIRLSLRFTI
ncbi:TonB-dependent receptor [Polymorphobacter glacialis]|uniref:TonB-dependent receptor n=1 Tax=Sandarakinorhabdus glacialis TaxID=1614636 RepID=A0A917E8Y7_9SPHN|nr:TonB-dependent receptor [Polymorphobacter glacialis]GGE12405.1 TonB-dependent receptor [Polymorphobacter glacialis]